MTNGRGLETRWRSVSVAVAAVILGCSTGPAHRATGDGGILVFSRTAGFRHTSIGPGVSALEGLASDAGVALHATEDPTVFTPTGLAGYDVVVFLSTTGDVLDAEQQAALEGYIRAGGGYAGIHSASDTEFDWPWYGRLVGAYFDGHPSNPNVRTASLVVVEADHPATRGLPATWVRMDEWYDLRDVQQGLSVLLDIDESSYKTSAEGPAVAPRPIAWYQELDGGRSFYTALGHTDESYSDPAFLCHVWGGVTWAMRR